MLISVYAYALIKKPCLPPQRQTLLSLPSPTRARKMLPVIRSRLATAFVGRASRRLLCTSTSVPKDPRFSYSSPAAYAGAAPPPPPPPPPASGSAWSKLLKFTLFGAVTGAAATTGYATYAYTLDEVDQKTKAFRASANYDVVGDNASTIDKIQAFVRSKAMKGCFITCIFELPVHEIGISACVPGCTPHEPHPPHQLKASVEVIELYLDLRRMLEEHVRDFTEPLSDKLLPDLPPNLDVLTLVLDLSDTLIHSDWKRERGWRTYKRPGVDAFLEQLCQYFEIVVYSDQLSTYVDEIVERLDQKNQCINFRLNRAGTKYQDGKHYRDLSKLNRDPSRIIYVSAHALENALQLENCVPIKAWTPEDMNDAALVDLIPFLKFVGTSRPLPDIRSVIASYDGRDIATEFLDRQRRIIEKNPRGGSFWRR